MKNVFDSTTACCSGRRFYGIRFAQTETKGGYEMFDMQQVGSRISKLRKSIGITQTGLADRLGISFQAVSNWERGVSHA